jgi:hypothetical protein|tara:strand:- start:348 stop:788 length:441 start_codon:yes stop_codon:yes gene_type:complete
MAAHKITTVYTKSGAAFNTITEAIETHMGENDYGHAERTIAEYESAIDGQSDFTETKALTANGSPVSAGTAGNGYQLTRTYTQAKLLEVQTAAVAANDKGDLDSNVGAGWTVTHQDINPSTNSVNPTWGGDGTDVAPGASFGVVGI